MDFSPNGQCFASAPRPSYNASVAALPGSVSFLAFNSLVASVSVAGAPADTSIRLDVTGQGFVYPPLPGAACCFTPFNTSQPAIFRALVVISTSLVRCNSPANGTAGLYTLTIVQNGRDPEPTLAGNPVFTTYEVAAIRVIAIHPPGGIAGLRTAVTVSGVGFARLGADQLVCLAGENMSVAESVPAGTLIDSQRMLCTLPAVQNEGAVAVGVSLNAGVYGTRSASTVTFQHYALPHLAAITPDVGSSRGGTVVTLQGAGFAALSATAAVRAAHLRCRFGATVQVLPPTSHNDTHVVCVTPWGEARAAGQPVSVALNGITFATRRSPVATTPAGQMSLAAEAELPHFIFTGLRPPALVEAYFPPDATTLIIRFDAQPTNRAGIKCEAAHPPRLAAQESHA